MLNEKQEAELHFWRNLVKSEGQEGFIRRRRADFYRHMNNFNGWADMNGYGIDVGSGVFSLMNFAPNYAFSIDPLAKEFNEIFADDLVRIGDGENIPHEDGLFDWLVNWNVIDHTPNPQKMADEMHRVLKTGGKLYFEVNFDDHLARPHYDLWTESKVNEVLGKFKLLYKNIIRNEIDKQYLYYGVYEKV